MEANRKFYRLVVALVVLGLISGCSSKPQQKPEQTSVLASSPAASKTDFAQPARVVLQGRDPLLVAPGHQIQIANAEDEKVNGKYRVNFDGVLKLPYDITIQAAGISENQLKQQIVRQYGKFFQTASAMRVSVVDKQFYVDVRGLVDKPGRYLVSRYSSLDEVIGKAGGLQRASDRGGPALAEYARVTQDAEVVVLRLADYYSGTARFEPVWAGGEKIFFQSASADLAHVAGADAKYVQVLGQVRSPGEYHYRSGADFFHYLVKSGGPTERADLGRISLIRGVGQDRQQVTFTMNQQVVPVILGGDILIVQSDVPTEIERKSRLYAELASIISALASVALLFVI